jgi:hypothetical protein
MKLSFAACMAIPCCIASYFERTYINEYMNRTKKSALLLFTMFYILMGSSILFLGKAIFGIFDDLNNGKNILET